MFGKIKSIYKHPYAQQLKDTRVLGLLAFGVIVLLVSWSGISVIETNYELQQQIARLEQQNKVAELENNNQKLRNQYYTTDQYLELQARRQFGKAAPGETLLLVPKNVALAHTTDIKEPAAAKEQENAVPHKPTYQQNFEAWMRFFFHRSS
jgi:cell division protein FtsB